MKMGIQWFEVVERLTKFVSYVKILQGDEKGEAQVFCDRLFQAFGHAGYKEAGATLEYRVKKDSAKGTSFADLMWKPRLLIEMKKGGEKLHLHYTQAFNYWLNAVPNRPRHVVLCNFKEFWIYDFDRQLDEPVDIVKLDDLSKRYTALNFLFPHDPKPIFNNDKESVSRRTADRMAELFKELTRRQKNPVPRQQAQRFLLQMMVAMFAEDIDLLPSGIVTELVEDCRSKGQSSYDLFGALFAQMNNKKKAAGGRFKDVRYFNGGLFSVIEPIELNADELEIIGGEKVSRAKTGQRSIRSSSVRCFSAAWTRKRATRSAAISHRKRIHRIIGPQLFVRGRRELTPPPSCKNWSSSEGAYELPRARSCVRKRKLSMSLTGS